MEFFLNTIKNICKNELEHSVFVSFDKLPPSHKAMKDAAGRTVGIWAIRTPAKSNEAQPHTSLLRSVWGPQ